ncbi:hypothetical protein F511_36351 [Dorcoceras hygrometricum]|uniref:Secreted protein n=1 Tax=Dorcoceras hygrometricum TaxID=472368 RepID=A0A2Z7AYR6_9LAMI|nr:hypothetical protein F511_36351 [Dorcoceras hygrometricum]
MCCCLRLVVQLVVTICLQLVVQSVVSNACDWMHKACDWMHKAWVDQTMSYQLIQTTSFAIHPRLVEYNAEALVWMYKLPAGILRLPVLCKFKTPSFLLQSNVVVLQSLAKHAIHQMLAPAGHCHRKVILLILIANAKRCRSSLFKRHRFAIANSKYYLLVDISFLLIFLVPAPYCDST